MENEIDGNIDLLAGAAGRMKIIGTLFFSLRNLQLANDMLQLVLWDLRSNRKIDTLNESVARSTRSMMKLL